MEWRPIDTDLPREEVLLWTGGRCVVGVLVSGSSSEGDRSDFMDSWSDSILPWPSHWMPLPSPPRGIK